MMHPRPRILAAILIGLCLAAASHLAEAGPAELQPANRPMAEVIDHYVDQGLKNAKVSPAPCADDANFIRRLSLDLLGRIPTIFEVRCYVDSTDPEKRTKLVEAKLASPEFVVHQVNEFDTLLMYGASGNLREYLGKALPEGRSWDKIFRDLVLGSSDQPELKGADEFLKVRVKDSDRLTNDVSVLFFGVNISCTQCHDHPLVPDWKQDHFYGMKSFFNRSFDNGGFVAEREYGSVTYKTPAGQDKPAKMMFLSGTLVEEPPTPEPSNDEKKKESQKFKDMAAKKIAPPAPKFSRRAQLLAVALKPGENRFIARSIVNRLCYRLLGQGLVMPVDQMHSKNPPSHPELLEWLERDFVAGGFDVTRVVRGIVLSQTYARGSRWEKGERPAAKLFAVGNVRPLTSYQYAASLKLASSDPAMLGPPQKPVEVQRRIDSLVRDSRGMAASFDMPQDNFQVSAAESLMMSNGSKIAGDFLTDRADRLLGRLKQISDRREQIDTAVWSILSRAPTADEAKLIDDYLAKRVDRPAEAWQQVTWALLSGAEFRFNY